MALAKKHPRGKRSTTKKGKRNLKHKKTKCKGKGKGKGKSKRKTMSKKKHRVSKKKKMKGGNEEVVMARHYDPIDYNVNKEKLKDAERKKIAEKTANMLVKSDVKETLRGLAEKARKQNEQKRLEAEKAKALEAENREKKINTHIENNEDEYINFIFDEIVSSKKDDQYVKMYKSFIKNFIMQKIQNPSNINVTYLESLTEHGKDKAIVDEEVRNVITPIYDNIKDIDLNEYKYEFYDKNNNEQKTSS